MAVYPEFVESDTIPTADALEETLNPLVESYMPNKKTRRSRRSAYRQKKQWGGKAAAEAVAAVSSFDTSTSCTESDISSADMNGTSSPSFPRRHVSHNFRNNHHHRSNMNMGFWSPSLWDPRIQFYDCDPRMFYCNESPLSSGDGSPDSIQDSKTFTQSFPLPIAVETLTKGQQEQYVALDCEMVGIGQDGLKSAVARVTIIDWHGGILMDEYVRQNSPVTDYRTYVSGITKEKLDGARMKFATCRERVQKLLNGKILVGHALENDLNALGIPHPWHMTRDTAKYEPFMKVRFNDGLLWPRALRELCREHLHRDVQVTGKPHCPYEDALAALDLYRTVWEDWEKRMEFKIHQARAIQHQNQLNVYFAALAAAN